VIAVLIVMTMVFAPSIALRAEAASWWTPPLGNQPWQWELDHPLNLHSAHDMGTNDTLSTGHLAPPPVIYDIDGIINPRSTVTALHAMGKHVVCYIEVGAAGNYYSAASEGIPTTYFEQLQEDGDFGKRVSGYPEYYLNIRSSSTVSIIESLIKQQCAKKGFDAVETDIDTEYADDSGFPLSESSEVRYMTALANYIHALGMGWWIKNPDDTGDNFASALYSLADAVLTEQCNQYSSCGLLHRYEGHKAVFSAEYALAPSRFCARDNALDFNGAQFNVNLSGVRRPCR
jgi:hypothetical protein